MATLVLIWPFLSLAEVGISPERSLIKPSSSRRSLSYTERVTICSRSLFGLLRIALTTPHGRQSPTISLTNWIISARDLPAPKYVLLFKRCVECLAAGILVGSKCYRGGSFSFGSLKGLTLNSSSSLDTSSSSSSSTYSGGYCSSSDWRTLSSWKRRLKFGTFSSSWSTNFST